MAAFADRKVVHKLVTLFGSLNEAVGLAAEEGEAGNIDGGIRTARAVVIKVRQAAASILESELVDLVVAECLRVLRGDGPVVLVLG